MSTSQQHLNKIRKWLRKKELDQTKSKVRNAMLKSYEQQDHIDTPMELQQYSNSRSSHQNHFFDAQKAFLLHSEQTTYQKGENIHWDQWLADSLLQKLKHIASEEQKNYELSDLLVIKDALGLLESLADYPIKKSTFSQCIRLLTPLSYKVIPHFLEKINGKNDQEGLGRYLESTISQMNHTIDFFEDKFWKGEAKEIELSFLLRMLADKLSVFLHYACLSCSDVMKKALAVCIQAIKILGPMNHICLEILNCAVKDSPFLIAKINRNELQMVLKYLVRNISADSDGAWSWRVSMILEITQKVMDCWIDELSLQQLRLMKHVIMDGISAVYNQQLKNYKKSVMASTLKLILNFSHRLRTLFPDENFRKEEQWALFLSKIIYESSQHKDMENYGHVACLMLRVMGPEGIKQLEQVVKYLSFKEKEPWLQEIAFDEEM